MLDDVEQLLDDVQINTEEEIHKKRFQHLVPLKDWGFPASVYAEGSPDGFGRGIWCDMDNIPISEILSNRFIPVPMHLFQTDTKFNEVIVNGFHKQITSSAPLWCNFSHITPFLMLLLTSKPPIKRVAILQHMETQVIEDYTDKKELYREGYHGFQETKQRLETLKRERCDLDNEISSLRSAFSDNEDFTDEKYRELSKQIEIMEADVKVMSRIFTRPPEEFIRTAEGHMIATRYLSHTRYNRMKEDVSRAQYMFGLTPPVLSTYEILYRYHRMRDFLEASNGFHDSVSNQRGYLAFSEVCKNANESYISDMETINTEILNEFPELKTVIGVLHRAFDNGVYIPDWSNISEFSEELLNAMHHYTLLMIVAVERCIMTMLGLTEEIQAYLVVTNQVKQYQLNEEDNDRFNSMDDVRAYNNIIHTLRTRYLPNWRNIASGSVACFDPRESKENIDAYLKNVMLNLAFSHYPRQNSVRTYLQLKQAVRPSVKVLVKPSPQKKIVIMQTDTLKPVPLFI